MSFKSKMSFQGSIFHCIFCAQARSSKMLNQCFDGRSCQSQVLFFATLFANIFVKIIFLPNEVKWFDLNEVSQKQGPKHLHKQ